MTLPKFPHEHASVDIDGEIILVHGLSRREVAQAQKLSRAAEDTGDWSELEIFVIACGTDTPIEEVRDWYGTVPNHVAPTVSNRIRELSRIDEEAQKSG